MTEEPVVPHEGDDGHPAGIHDGAPSEPDGPNYRTLWRTTVIVAGLALIAALAGWIMNANADARRELYEQQQTTFEEITGIRVLRIVMTAGGGVVELQYQTLDPDKALAVHDDEAPPQLIDERTGAVVAIPFHEHANRELHTAVTYREMFMNGGGALDRGSKVTLTVGDAVIEHIEVQ